MSSELLKDQRPLMIAGLLCLLCLTVLAIFTLFDSTEILGINRWIKPMKFFVSFAIFFWTTAIYLYYLQGFEKSARFLSWATILIFVVEMLIILMQVLRGTTSHFNTRTPLDAILYGVMGFAIFINTLLFIYLLALYFRAKIDLPESIIWGMRLGLILFLAASFEGGYMSAQIGHSVGAADGGAGLPVVNWSTKSGDLRVAHFFGMHAFQAVPFFSHTLEKYNIKSPTVWTFAFAAVYFAIFSFLFVQALQEKPFFAGF